MASIETTDFFDAIAQVADGGEVLSTEVVEGWDGGIRGARFTIARTGPAGLAVGRRYRRALAHVCARLIDAAARAAVAGRRS